MSRGSNRFARALNATFVGTGNVMGVAADFFIGPGFGNSARTAGQIVGLAAGAIGEATWIGASLVGTNVRDKKSRDLIGEIQDASMSDDFRLMLNLSREFSQREAQEPMGYAWQATAHSKLGQRRDALDAVEKAARAGLRRSEVDLLSADIEAEAGNFASAVEHFTRLADDPDYRPHALTGRANALLNLGRIDEALQDANDALAISEQGETYLVRANIHRTAGDLPLSLADFNRVVEIAPYVPELLSGRIAVFELLGMHAQAGVDRKVLEAIELLLYLEDSGVLISLSPNGRSIELRGASIGNETMSRIAASKIQLIQLMESLDAE